ncbi:peroxiredoxin [Nocardioides sp. WS12]|uniref:peroxiredoxin n=1 Tax=Nocardioides sp. WS12 TaxID=2486272 RepID=UPI0015FA2D66|nr:peroxiredoxin [Nocardioides sp. WS12]
MRPSADGSPPAAEGIALGGLAPDFTLRDQFGQDISLASYRGKKAVALVFYPYAFSGVCTGEMGGIRARLDEFLTFDTEILAISCDPVYALRAFSDSDGLNFGLLSDFWPHGEVARAYGVFDDAAGSPQRSSYVVDKDGRLSWAVHHRNPDARNLDDLLVALRNAAGE